MGLPHRRGLQLVEHGQASTGVKGQGWVEEAELVA